MSIKEGDTLAAESKVSSEKEKPNTSTYPNYSANPGNCKPFNRSFFSKYDRVSIAAQLQAYLDLGLVPLPLRGKIPARRWRHGWNPKTITNLKSFIQSGNNWGIKTGGNFAAIDFDSKDSFTSFIVANIDHLPDDLPIVKTGRGYHIWFKPTQPIREAHLDEIDIKGEGGQIVVPPSIHPETRKRYAFIRAPKGFIPELDITKLVFPGLKKKEGAGGRRVAVTPDDTGDRLRFDFSRIKDGVKEGGRHAALVSFIGYLLSRAKSLEEIYDEAGYWNQCNKPPLTEAEVTATVDDCWQRYGAKYGKAHVPTKTHYKRASVLIGTESYPRIDPRQRLFAPESPHPEPENAWEPEIPYSPAYDECGKKRSIIRNGRDYISVSFFCGRWNCPRCGPFFRQRWIDHFTKKAQGMPLFLAEIGESDWGRVSRSINRLGADYLRLKVGGVFKVVTDKPLKESAELRQEDLKPFLETSIPHTAGKCPISTSRNWQREKNTKRDTEYKVVTSTWLPVKDQAEVAQNLGAKMISWVRWLSPEDTDQDEWAKKLKEEIRKREEYIDKAVMNPLYRTSMLEYLNRQYAEDIMNDKYHEDAFDRLVG